SNTSLVHGFYFPKNIYQVFDETVVFEKGNLNILNHWKKHLAYFVQKLNYKYSGKRILLKSPANTGRVKEILELYPDACFIHIHRDPYIVYQSNEKLFEKILPILGFQKVGNKFIEDYILYSYEKMHMKYLRDKLNIPYNQLFELSYVNFVSSPIEEIRKIYNHLNLGDFEKAKPYFKEEIKSVEDYQKNSYLVLDEKIKTKIAEKWSFFFEEYGYKK
ncbi:MAG: sulfotransferase, partial [Bacteroidetes bacterium]|nr:sulfotransferase [Bacteroidota bacterium]